MRPLQQQFPHKGEYRTWDKHWNPTGYAPAPQHKGQMPVTFPTDATPLACFLGGYID